MRRRRRALRARRPDPVKLSYWAKVFPIAAAAFAAAPSACTRIQREIAFDQWAVQAEHTARAV